MPLPKRRYKDLTGQKFGKLTVLHVSDQSTPMKIKFYCQCDCGNFTHSRSNALQSGRAASCGCMAIINSRIASNNKSAAYYPKAHVNEVYLQYKHGARRKNLLFELSIEYLQILISRPCYYCGMLDSNTVTKNGKGFDYNGIDRVDNTKGYIEDNVVTACITCNMMKRDMPYKDWNEWLRRVTIYQKEKGNEDFYYHSDTES